MTNYQIELLRFIIKAEIEAAGLNGMEHGARDRVRNQLEEDWEDFRKSFEAQ